MTLITKLKEIIDSFKLTYNDLPVYTYSVKALDFDNPGYSPEVKLGITQVTPIDIRDTFNNAAQFQNMMFTITCETSPYLTWDDNESFINSVIKKLLHYTDDTILMIRLLGGIRNFGPSQKEEEILGYNIEVKTTNYFNNF